LKFDLAATALMFYEIVMQLLLVLDEVSDGLVAWDAYTFAGAEDATYEIQPYRMFTIVSILAISSNYIIAYSALLKMRLDQGDYEPA